ncbi:hypothetical protein [Shewanella aestuarii]|uniref:Uncharacterized protein n=1 Tax=Shewanella aestuarii TaxID=1028752 RepID=A0A6G9QP12_9GAMM|nr:hypothetical protein [Shewanella aestuarii]QIR16306.1 hypothetical protein HBH39_17625 [Shewanella aestuarii]
MNKLSSTINNLKDFLSLSDRQVVELNKLVSNTINTRFEFGSEFYSLNDVHPTTLGEALTPYLLADVLVTELDMALQARYVERKSAFEFEIDLTLEGMKRLLIEHTAITAITVNPVYASDELRIDNATQTIHHKVSGDKTELDGLYCIIDLEDGQSFLNQMTAEEAQQALYANCNQRLNGVNPYISQVKKEQCHLMSCLRRSLKNISAMHSVENHAYIATLLDLHDRQYTKAQELRKVAYIKNRYRNCVNQPSVIDAIFKKAQGAVVVPFSHASEKTERKNIDHSVFAPIHKDGTWDGDDFGMGF